MLSKIINQEEHFQNQYDAFIQEYPAKYVVSFNGLGMSPVEYDILTGLRPRSLIDVGCADGKRFFHYYLEHQIDFVGLEKHEHIRDNAYPHWREKILIQDIARPNLTLAHLKFSRPVDLVVMFCYVFGGLHRQQDREAALENISAFLNPGGFFVMDGQEFPLFYESDRGLEKRFSPLLPFQYFPSYKEIVDLTGENELKLIKMIKTTGQEQKLYFIFRKN